MTKKNSSQVLAEMPKRCVTSETVFFQMRAPHMDDIPCRSAEQPNTTSSPSSLAAAKAECDR